MADLPADDVHDILVNEKNVDYLYHANTVLTSCTYLRHGALLSRKVCDDHQLPQTPQYTDDDDRGFGLWNNIFLDTCDIHDRASTANKYGPVLFILSLDFLLSDDLDTVKITRANPANWEVWTPASDRWYQSIGEVQQDFSKYDFGSHLVLEETGGHLSLSLYLQTVKLDEPRRDLDSGGRLGAMPTATGALVGAESASEVSPSFEIRNCEAHCGCLREYERFSTDEIIRRFGMKGSLSMFAD